MADADAEPARIPLDEVIAEHDGDLEAPEIGVVEDSDSPGADVAEPPAAEDLGPEALSWRVIWGAIPCAGPVYSYFQVPKQAFPYTARFVFVNAVGGRTYSGFAYWNRSEYPPTRIYARYPSAVPRGTRQVWAYWWCGVPADHDPGSPYWNYKGVNC